MTFDEEIGDGNRRHLFYFLWIKRWSGTKIKARREAGEKLFGSHRVVTF
jgi:hypothetical protein